MPKNIRRKRIAKEVADALIALGYTSLDDQAKALGIHRATAWTIIKKNTRSAGGR